MGDEESWLAGQPLDSSSDGKVWAGVSRWALGQTGLQDSPAGPHLGAHLDLICNHHGILGHDCHVRQLQAVVGHEILQLVQLCGVSCQLLQHKGKGRGAEHLMAQELWDRPRLAPLAPS